MRFYTYITEEKPYEHHIYGLWWPAYMRTRLHTYIALERGYIHVTPVMTHIFEAPHWAETIQIVHFVCTYLRLNTLDHIFGVTFLWRSTITSHLPNSSLTTIYMSHLSQQLCVRLHTCVSFEMSYSWGTTYTPLVFCGTLYTIREDMPMNICIRLGQSHTLTMPTTPGIFLWDCSTITVRINPNHSWYRV